MNSSIIGDLEPNFSRISPLSSESNPSPPPPPSSQPQQAAHSTQQYAKTPLDHQPYGPSATSTVESTSYYCQAAVSSAGEQTAYQPSYNDSQQQQWAAQSQAGQMHPPPSSHSYAQYAQASISMQPSTSSCYGSSVNVIRSPFEMEEEELAEKRRAKSTPPIGNRDMLAMSMPSMFEMEMRIRRNAWLEIPPIIKNRLPFACTGRLKVPYPIPGVGPSPMNPMVRMPPQFVYQSPMQMAMLRGNLPRYALDASRLTPPHPAAMMARPLDLAGQQRCDSVPAAPKQKGKKGGGKKQQQAAAIANTPASVGIEQSLPPRAAQPMMVPGGFPHLHPMTEQRINNLDPCKRCSNPINAHQGIRCTALSQGCGGSYHLECAQLSQDAFIEIAREPRLEWICQQCFSSKPVILSM